MRSERWFYDIQLDIDKRTGTAQRVSRINCNDVVETHCPWSQDELCNSSDSQIHQQHSGKDSRWWPSSSEDAHELVQTGNPLRICQLPTKWGLVGISSYWNFCVLQSICFYSPLQHNYLSVVSLKHSDPDKGKHSLRGVLVWWEHFSGNNSLVFIEIHPNKRNFRLRGTLFMKQTRFR